MDVSGVIFERKELAVFDGPGIRTTVFFKGCPLRCQWCHNPEGLSPRRELMVSPNGCTGCNRCRTACPTPDHCTLCGACVTACPQRLRKICGEVYTPDALATLLKRDEAYLTANGGGVTFSGGEPTMQGEFLIQVLNRLPTMHKAMETCGHCDSNLFQRVIAALDYVILDLKLMDEEKHKHYTGVSNQQILKNLDILKASGRPFLVRIPVIPGVNDDDQNFIDTAALLQNTPTLEKVELLPYHITAGAKYSMVQRQYNPEFNVEAKPKLNTEIFARYGVSCTQL